MIKKNKLLLCLNTEFWLKLGDEQGSTLPLHHRSSTLSSLTCVLVCYMRMSKR